MVLVVAVVGLAALVPLSGGRVSRLLGLRFRAPEVLAVALGLQVLLTTAGGPAVLRGPAHVASVVAGVAFVWLNRDLPGMWLVGTGAVSNGLAIAANGGTMPASEAALRSAGLAASAGSNSTLVPEPVLPFLGDVFAVPSSWPLSNVFSVGDVLIALGAVYAVYAVCGSRLVPPWWRWSEAVEAARRAASSPGLRPSGRPSGRAR